MLKLMLALCLLASSIALANPPDAVDTYTLKNGGLKFTSSFQQNLKEIKQTDSRIQLIPAPASKDSRDIPYAVLCADVPIKEKKNLKLAMIAVTAQSKIPAAMMSSSHNKDHSARYAVTIGGDDFEVRVDVPSTSQDAYAVGMDVSLAAADPNQASDQEMSLSTFKNDAPNGHQTVHSVLSAGKYHFVGYIIHMETPGYVSMSAHSSFSDREYAESQFFPDSDNPGFAGSTSMDYDLSLGNGGSSMAALSAQHKISICWKPNNYSAVTMEAAELINPKVELYYYK